MNSGISLHGVVGVAMPDMGDSVIARLLFLVDCVFDRERCILAAVTRANNDSSP